MAHKILSEGLHQPAGQGNRHSWEHRAQYVSEKIVSAQCFIADNVAAYYESSVVREFDMETALPNVRLPFPYVFVDYAWTGKNAGGRTDIKRLGALLCQGEKEEAEDLISEFKSKVMSERLFSAWGEIPNGYMIEATPFILNDRNQVMLYNVSTLFFINAQNGVHRYFSINAGDVGDDSIAGLQTIFHVPLLMACFLNCKNTTKHDATETVGPTKKWLRRMRQPDLRYHVVNIEPMKRVLKSSGDSEANGLGKALHICRGHFVTYSEERPLFGRVAGTFWKPSHVRGSIENGAVVKDYAVKVPT